MKKIGIIAAALAGLALLAAPVIMAQQAPDVVILKGAPTGGVKLTHADHVKFIGDKKCETCHHASKPEKPNKSPNQKCQECHTKTATPPMKTKTQLAFHNPLAKAGLCIDCHVKENAGGKKAPVKCNDCHKKENK